MQALYASDLPSVLAAMSIEGLQLLGGILHKHNFQRLTALLERDVVKRLEQGHQLSHGKLLMWAQ